MRGEIPGLKDKYYMAIAILSERRSKDPERQVGACIVNEREGRIVGIGYNGMPINCRDDIMPWSEKNEKKEKLKHLYVTHAEMNAVVNMTPQSVAGCAIYVTLHPCNECAKILVRSGISKVVYLSFDGCYEKKPEFQLSKSFLTKLKEDKKIQYERFSCPDLFQSKDKLHELLFDEPLSLSRPRYNGYKPGEKFIRKQIEKEKNGESPASELKQLICRAEELRDFLRPISWEQYFMGLAITAKDMMCNTRIDKAGGACIVNEDKRIVGMGFHEMQFGEENEVNTGRCLVLHAPVSAIVNKNPVSMRGCTLYVTRFPCNECAKVIVQSGIKAVIYLEDPQTGRPRRSSRKRRRLSNGHSPDAEENRIDAARRMFHLAKVRCVSYKDCYELGSIIVDFSESNIR